MNRRIILTALLIVTVLVLAGCSMPTVDQMYSPPKRSEEYSDLQSAIDSAMAGLEYCAPLSGENQQTVQMADLDGDGVQEALLFAKAAQERPLRILIFRNVDDSYVHVDTIAGNGTAFEQVEYVPMDDLGGMEIVVGRQLNDQILRSVSVYKFSENGAEQMLSANYTKYLTVDLDSDGFSELFILRPGQTDTDNGIAELYSVEKGTVNRSNEVNMSQPADKLKRVIVGRLHGGQSAVYAASAVGDTAIITDVYAVLDDMLTNVSFSNESGTSVQTLRNYYVYADDIDNDTVVELPALMQMFPLKDTDIISADSADRHELIRWYAMTINGDEVHKKYTYHNFVGGWYWELDSNWAQRLTVINLGYRYEFYILDKHLYSAEKVMTLYALTGQGRKESDAPENVFELLRTDSIVYVASLEPAAEHYGLTQENVVNSFHLIQRDWKSGEI